MHCFNFHGLIWVFWIVANDKLTTWEVEYLDVLRQIPETLRKDPPASIGPRTGNEIRTRALALIVNQAYLHRGTHRLRAAVVIKNHIRHLPQQRRAADRAAAKATTVNQPGEAK